MSKQMSPAAQMPAMFHGPPHTSHFARAHSGHPQGPDTTSPEGQEEKSTSLVGQVGRQEREVQEGMSRRGSRKSMLMQA